MPGFLLNMLAKAKCAHGGTVVFPAPNPRVKIMGSPVPMGPAVTIMPDCQMKIPPPAGPGPTPCISAVFLPPTLTLRVKSMGQGLLCQTSATGPAVTTPPSPPVPILPIISAGQTRVKGM